MPWVCKELFLFEDGRDTSTVWWELEESEDTCFGEGHTEGLLFQHKQREKVKNTEMSGWGNMAWAWAEATKSELQLPGPISLQNNPIRHDQKKDQQLKHILSHLTWEEKAYWEIKTLGTCLRDFPAVRASLIAIQHQQPPHLARDHSTWERGACPPAEWRAHSTALREGGGELL